MKHALTLLGGFQHFPFSGHLVPLWCRDPVHTVSATRCLGSGPFTSRSCVYPQDDFISYLVKCMSLWIHIYPEYKWLKYLYSNWSWVSSCLSPLPGREQGIVSWGYLYPISPVRPDQAALLQPQVRPTNLQFLIPHLIDPWTQQDTCSAPLPL